MATVAYWYQTEPHQPFGELMERKEPVSYTHLDVYKRQVYTVGIKSSQFSFGAAVGLFNTVINFVFLLVTNYISKRTTGTGLM